MKVMFVVQGEGRGHLTQAITMQRMLQHNGHQVVEVLVGKSNYRQLPEFFTRAMTVPVKQFYSPNFLPTAKNKRNNIPQTVAYNIMEIPTYLRSVWYLHRCINNSGADLVINFYDMLTGITYFLFHPTVPQVSIGHQYLFLHRDFQLPKTNRLSLLSLKFLTRVTALGAQARLALSFYRAADDDEEGIRVVPPLLRAEVPQQKVTRGEYVHGYMVNAGYGRSVMEWHRQHPDIPLNFFWDKRGAAETTIVDDTLTFHQLDDHKFLASLAGCRSYATTAGFESVCEAMYFGKPIMMIPAHVEQECNAYDAYRTGAGVISRDFDLGQLAPLLDTYKPIPGFREWVNSAEQVIIPMLEQAANVVPCYPLSVAWLKSFVF